MLQEKEIEINGTKYRIRELSLEEGLNFKQAEDPKETTYEFVSKALVEPKLTPEELKKLSFKEGIKVINIVNELNGLTQGFSNPKEPSATN